MRHTEETLLATLPGSTERERVLVVHIHGSETSRMELRQQSWGEGVGWFTQSSVELAPQQVGQLRLALGSAPARVRGSVASPAPAASVSATDRGFRVYHADSA